MGLLSDGEPLSWEETKKLAGHVHLHGAKQFLALYERLKHRQRDGLKWGDEVEYMIVTLDNDHRTARLALKAHELLFELQKDESAGKKDLACLWRPEYSSYMIEGTPGAPYGVSIDDMNKVEKNMRWRRKAVEVLLQPNEHLMSITNFPRLGCNPFTLPDCRPDPENSFTRSLYWPSEGTYLGHPRFKTLTR